MVWWVVMVSHGVVSSDGVVGSHGVVGTIELGRQRV
jgi:hypothetical protein